MIQRKVTEKKTCPTVGMTWTHPLTELGLDPCVRQCQQTDQLLFQCPREPQWGRGFQQQQQLPLLLWHFCVSTYEGSSDQNEKTPCRKIYTGMVSHRYAVDNAASARPSAEKPSYTRPKGSERVFPQCVLAGGPSGGSSQCTSWSNLGGHSNTSSLPCHSDQLSMPL